MIVMNSVSFVRKLKLADKMFCFVPCDSPTMRAFPTFCEIRYDIIREFWFRCAKNDSHDRLTTNCEVLSMRNRGNLITLRMYTIEELAAKLNEIFWARSEATMNDKR